MLSHADIINRWPSLSDFAFDLEIAYGTAKAMRRRSSIPPEYWTIVVSKAAERGINQGDESDVPDVTFEALAEAVAIKRQPPQDDPAETCGARFASFSEAR